MTALALLAEEFIKPVIHLGEVLGTTIVVRESRVWASQGMMKLKSSREIKRDSIEVSNGENDG